MTAILQVFGTFLLWLYKICGGSYALALIVFTLLTKIILFPLSYKGKKGMMQMNTMQAEMARLQKQYGNNRVKYNEEVQKLYEREGVNPMSGCLWSFLPLPILMALYYVIRRPMLYMMHLTTDQIAAAIKAVEKLGTYTLSGSEIYQEMQVAGLMYGHQDVFSAVQTAVGDGASKLEIINFNFLGLDLSQIPKLKFWENGVSWASIGLFLIPIIVTVLNVGYSRLSQKTNNFNKNQKGSGNASMDRTNKMMLFIMPLMYLWFGYHARRYVRLHGIQCYFHGCPGTHLCPYAPWQICGDGSGSSETVRGRKGKGTSAQGGDRRSSCGGGRRTEKEPWEEKSRQAQKSARSQRESGGDAYLCPRPCL